MPGVAGGPVLCAGLVLASAVAAPPLGFPVPAVFTFTSQSITAPAAFASFFQKLANDNGAVVGG